MDWFPRLRAIALEHYEPLRSAPLLSPRTWADSLLGTYYYACQDATFPPGRKWARGASADGGGSGSSGGSGRASRGAAVDDEVGAVAVVELGLGEEVVEKRADAGEQEAFVRLRGGFVRLWPGGSALLERQRASERAFDAVVAKPAGGGVVADVFARQGKRTRF